MSRYQDNSRRIAARWQRERLARANPLAMVAMLGGKVSILGPFAVLTDLVLLALVALLGIAAGRGHA